MTSVNDTTGTAPVPDRLIIRAIWPVILAAVISLFPFTIYSTFLVPIADDTGADPSAVGAFRGFGGLAALVVGVAIAPLIARWSTPRLTAAGLGALSVTSVIGTLDSVPALVIFCLGIGGATAVLTPALLSTATSTYSAPGDSGRAATLVTATQSLAAVLAAPVIGVIGLWGGWHGALWVTAVLAALTAVLFLRAGRSGARTTAGAPAYRQAFRRLRRRRDLLALIGIAALRTTSFMGYLAFLAAHFHERFGWDAVAFTLIWTLSGASFFTGNFLAGRWARVGDARRGALLLAGLTAAVAAVLVVFLTDLFPLALAATVVMGFGHAVVAAQVTTLIAHRGGDLTASAFSINAAGMSLGVFTGAFIGGVGLSVAGSGGLALGLALPSVVALALIRPALRGAGGGRGTGRS